MRNELLRELPDIPDRLISHFEMESGLVYALPEELLDALKQPLHKVLTPQVFSDECELSAVAELCECVAFRRCLPVRVPRLAQSIKPVTANDLASTRVPCGNSERQSADLTAYLENAHRYSRGYCGWLVQQREFRSEIDSLRETHGEALSVTERGFPPMQLGLERIPGYPEYTDEVVQCVQAIYRKWRLQQLATIDLPVPHEPQMAAANAYVQGGAEGCITPHIPDIFPIDGTGPVVKQMENARNSLHAPHLNEWKRLIGSTSHQKKQVATYARQFQFQHYFRVIRQRYPDQLQHKKGVLYESFASWFGASKDTIERLASKLDDLLDRPLDTML
jgi:hypothetical protein